MQLGEFIMIKKYIKQLLACIGVFIAILSFIFLISAMITSIMTSDVLYKNMEKEILEKKRGSSFNHLLNNNQKDINFICAIPRYYHLYELKNKLLISKINYYKFILLDLSNNGEQTWWFLSFNNKNDIILYKMPYKFLLNRKDFFCFKPNSKLNYLGQNGVFFNLSVEE